MTNQPYHQDDPSASGKWGVDSFTIRMLHVEYIDSMENTQQLLAHKKHYEVKYDVDLLFPGDAVSMRMHVLVNGEGNLPGYRIACTYPPDQVHIS